MKIWVLEIGEPLPLEKNVRMHRYGMFTKWLAQKGHEVTWWTTSFSHTPKKNFVDSNCDKTIDGVTLRFMYSPGYQRNVSLARIRHNKNFAIFFARNAEKYPPPDIIIAPIPTIEAAFEAVKFGKQNRIATLLDIRDLWPDELVDLFPKPLRGLSKFALKHAFGQMEFACSQATGIMGVAQSYVDYGLKFAKRTLKETDLVFPLGYSDPPSAHEPLSFALRNDSFKVCFFGTLGRFFDIETVIKSAHEIEREFPVDFVIAGVGSNLENYKAMSTGISNVIFPGWLNANQIAATMAICDVGLAPYKVNAKMSLPNKPFEYMAGGLPIISSLQGELKNYLEKYNCGLTYKADSVKELSDCIRTLRKNPKLREQMKNNSRTLLNEHFTIEKIFTAAESHLTKVVKPACANPPSPEHSFYRP